MSERQETVHVVSRALRTHPKVRIPVKVYDDRSDARAYRKRMNERSKRYVYSYTSVKKG